MAAPILIHRAAGLSLAMMLTLAPQAALACPYCAGRAQGSVWTNVILAVFVSLPFFFSWALYRFIRAHQDPSPSPPPGGEPPAYSRPRRQAS